MNIVRKLLLFLFLLTSVMGYSQTVIGNLTISGSLTTNRNQTYDMYSTLNSGTPVMIDISATWCPPCWSVHRSKILDQVHNGQGSFTTRAEVYFLEGDTRTTDPCMYGQSCYRASKGNWVSGTSYPMFNPSSTKVSQIKSLFPISGYPTFYLVAVNKKRYALGYPLPTTSLPQYIRTAALRATATVNGSSVTLNVQGGSSSSNLSYRWSNGSTTKNPSNLAPGTYSCTITDRAQLAGKTHTYTLSNVVVKSSGETCLAPSGVKVGSTTSTSAVISWVKGSSSANRWKVEYGNRGFTTGSGQSVEVYSTSTTLNGLLPGGSYEALVYEYCNGSYQKQSQRVSFTTGANCGTPTSLSASNTDGTSATLSWNKGLNTATQWKVEYGPRGFSKGYGTAREVYNTTSLQVTGLVANTAYDFYVYEYCNGSYTNPAGPAGFQTSASCSVPFSLSSSNITSTTADVAWVKGDKAASQWKVEYGPKGFTRGTGQSLESFSLTTMSIKGLKENTTYDFYVYEICNNTYDKAAGPASFQTTAGVTCSLPSSLAANSVTASDASVSWVKGSKDAAQWKIEFGPKGFQLGSGQTTESFSLTSTTLKGLKAGTTYDFYVYELCKNAYDKAAGPVSFQTSTATPTCQLPTTLTANNITANDAAVSWVKGNKDAAQWKIEYGPQGFSLGSGQSVESFSLTSTTLKGLKANTAYQFYVYEICNGKYDKAAGPVAFLTPAASCPLPFAIKVTNITTNDATVSWVKGDKAANQWKVEYGTKGFQLGSGQSVEVTNETTTTIKGLKENTTYAVYVYELCNGKYDKAEGPISFATNAGCGLPGGLNAYDITSASVTLQWKPSPAGGVNWQVEYGPKGFTRGSGTVLSAANTPSIGVKGLSASTTYDFYVSEQCSGAYKEWAGPASFTTSDGDTPTEVLNDICSGAEDITQFLNQPAFAPKVNMNIAKDGYTPFSDPAKVGSNTFNSWNNTEDAYKDVWYKVTPKNSGSAYFGFLAASTKESNFDTKIAIYDRCPTGKDDAAVAVISGNDDFHGAPNFTSYAPAAVVPGQTYYIQVASYGPKEVGTLKLEVDYKDISGAAPHGSGYHNADMECTDAQGWTHYVDTLGGYVLLSVNKGKENLGWLGISDKITCDVNSLSGAVDLGKEGDCGSTAFYATVPHWIVMNRIWDFKPINQPKSQVEIRSYYTTDDYDQVNKKLAANNINAVSESDLVHYKISNGVSSLKSCQNDNNGGLAKYKEFMNLQPFDCKGGSGKYVQYFVSSFSGGGGGSSGSGGGALPVDFISINAYADGASNVIEWVVAKEEDVEKYVVEKSETGDDWGVVDMISAINTEEEHGYSVVDGQAYGNTYYRVRSVDFDGSNQLSSIAYVRRADNDNMQYVISPNPVKGTLKVKMSEGARSGLEYKIFNAQGEEVLSNTIDKVSDASFDVNTSLLGSGMYILQIKKGDATMVQKFMKQ